jgi:hypothetical protein
MLGDGGGDGALRYDANELPAIERHDWVPGGGG